MASASLPIFSTVARYSAAPAMPCWAACRVEPLPFEQVKTSVELQQQLAAAQQKGQTDLRAGPAGNQIIPALSPIWTAMLF
jgi:hypothetical protein